MSELRTLYVSRPLINAVAFVKWAKSVGFDKTLDPGDMHVTIAFSRAKVNWDKFVPDSTTLYAYNNPGDARVVTPLGDKGAVVMKFPSPYLQTRWKQFLGGGCSWDYPSYQPHVSITYNGDPTLKVEPYSGVLIFGSEKFTEVVEDWDKKVVEK